MKTNIRFGSWEGGMLLANLLAFKLLTEDILVFTKTAGTAGWMMAIYVCAVGFLLTGLTLALFEKFSGHDFLDIISWAFGDSVKKVAAGIVALILWLNALTTLAEVTESSKIMALAKTPASLMEFFYIAAAVLAAYAGLEAIVRIHSFAVPAFCGVLALIFAFAAKLVDSNNFFPLMGTGADRVFKDGFHAIFIFREFIVFFLIAPFLGTHRLSRRAALRGVGVFSLFAVILVTYYISLIEYPASKQVLIPAYEIIRISCSGSFFEWFGALFFIIWVFGMLLYISVHIYLICYTIAKAFCLKDKKMLILPVSAMLFFVLAANFDIKAVASAYHKAAWVFAVLLPILLVAAARLKQITGRKRGDRHGKTL